MLLALGREYGRANLDGDVPRYVLGFRLAEEAEDLVTRFLVVAIAELGPASCRSA